MSTAQRTSAVSDVLEGISRSVVKKFSWVFGSDLFRSWRRLFPDLKVDWSSFGVPSPSSWNRLKRYGFRAVKSVASVLDVSSYAAEISDRVYRVLGFDSGVLVEAPPRVGKTLSVPWTAMRWVVENDVANYAVIVVEPTRLLAFRVYEYAVREWKLLYSLLKYGAAENALTLSEKVRVALYIGGEFSCLRGLRHHSMEDCLKCELNKVFSKYWSKVPRTPFVDPIMLMSSGYCPFHALFSPGFVRNSVIITTYDSLDVVIRAVLREGVKKVIIIVDEWFEYVMRKSVKISKIDPSEYPEPVRGLIEEWNRLVDGLTRLVQYYYAVKYGENPVKLVSDLLNVADDVDGRVRELIDVLFDSMRRVVERMEDVARGLVGAEKFKVRRLARRLRRQLSVDVHLYDPSRRSWDTRRVLRFSLCNGGLCVASYATELSSVIEDLRRSGALVGFVGLAPLLPRIGNYYVLPTVFDRVSVIRLAGKVRRVCVAYARSVDLVDPVRGALDVYKLIKDVRDRKERLWIVVNKNVAQKILRLFANDLLGRFGAAVEPCGDLERGVIDYIRIVFPSGSEVVISYVHGRLSYGVDLPFEVDRVLILGGVRRDPRSLPFVVVPTDFVRRLLAGEDRLRSAGMEVECLSPWFAPAAGTRILVRAGDGRYLLVEGRGDAAVVYVYDSLQFLYDAHVLTQVIGRLYLRSFKSLHTRYDYWTALRYVRLFEPRRDSKRVESLKDLISDLEKALAKTKSVYDFMYGLWSCLDCKPSIEFVDESGRILYASRPEDVLGRGEFGFDDEKYYRSRMNEFRNLERRLRRRVDERLVAKFIVYLYYVVKDEDRVEEFVESLPAEIKEKVEMFFPAVRSILEKLFPPRRRKVYW